MEETPFFLFLQFLCFVSHGIMKTFKNWIFNAYKNTIRIYVKIKNTHNRELKNQKKIIKSTLNNFFILIIESPVKVNLFFFKFFICLSKFCLE